ncbi:MAG: C40 family peptidase [bacterium]|nr:C40 family peptidase [bacterium]
MQTHRPYTIFILLFGIALLGASYKNPKPMVVKVIAANVRAKPVEHNNKYWPDPFQNTQLEEGEAVLVWEVEGEWAKVQCPDQLVYNYRTKRWEPCTGWVQANRLSEDLSTMKKIVKYDLPEDQLRKIILVKAAQHLDSMYLWGGCSLYDPDYKDSLTGVDCSGLVNWSYRRIGIITPRDANDQFKKAQAINRQQLLPGDLVFLASAGNRSEVRHVLIYAGGEEMIEAPKTGERVRRITFQEKIGLPLSKLRHGQRVHDKVVYFGTFFRKK